MGSIVGTPGGHFAKRVLALVRERAEDRINAGQAWTVQSIKIFRAEMRLIADNEAATWRVSRDAADAVLEMIEEAFTLELPGHEHLKLRELEARLGVPPW